MDQGKWGWDQEVLGQKIWEWALVIWVWVQVKWEWDQEDLEWIKEVKNLLIHMERWNQDLNLVPVEWVRKVKCQVNLLSIRLVRAKSLDLLEDHLRSQVKVNFLCNLVYKISRWVKHLESQDKLDSSNQALENLDLKVRCNLDKSLDLVVVSCLERK